VNTFWGACGITAVLDEAGRLLHEFEPMPYACLLQPVNWVPLPEGAAPADLVLLSTHPRQGGLIDGQGRRLVTFPDDGHPMLCSDARDLDGDGIDEVLTWNEEEIWIYKADVKGREPANYPRRNPWHNDSNYRAQVSLPRSS
jgi:rhamnogalacturonan endolyase